MKKSRKIFNIEHIFSLFRENIIAAYIPGYYLCIDETLRSFRVHCSFRQYMPKKPAKYGILFFNICCISSSDSIPYIGKSGENEKNSKETGTKVVENLSKRFFNAFRCIAMDNYFTSIPLAKKLF